MCITTNGRQENNVSSDESLSYSVEDIYQKIKELGLPEPANKFRSKKNTLVNLISLPFLASSTFLFLALMLE
jgi:hypothetical protein